MRRFYSLLAAFVCATSMIASAAVMSPKGPRTVAQPVKNASIEAAVPQTSMKKANAKTTALTSVDDLVGKYDMIYYYYYQTYSNWYTYNSPCEITKVDDTHVAISNFWDVSTNNITCTVDLAAGTITIPTTAVLFTNSYGSAGVSLLDTSSWNPLTSQPLVLTYSDGYLLSSDYWCVYMLDGTYAGYAWDVCAYVQLTPCNSVFTMSYNDEDGNLIEGTYYADAILENNVLKVANMAGFGFDNYVEFDLDPETKTAVAQNQAFYTSDEYNYYFYSYDDNGNMDDQVLANIEGDNNNVISFTNWTVYIPEADYNYGQLLDSTLTTPFNLCGEDNNAVHANVADENATVEYFNLQGVKISQPTEKGIYIRRAGHEVSKIAL